MSRRGWNVTSYRIDVRDGDRWVEARKCPSLRSADRYVALALAGRETRVIKITREQVR